MKDSATLSGIKMKYFLSCRKSPEGILDNSNIIVEGLPKDISQTVSALSRSRILTVMADLMSETKEPFVLLAGEREQVGKVMDSASKSRRPGDDREKESRASYSAQNPFYLFEDLIVSDDVRQELLAAVELHSVKELVFSTWGLSAIEPFPKTALNFYGPPGTGKTFAAHGIANRVGRPIMLASYADIESKYHGDGPKNVKALFAAAEAADAVLFIDEADSLLSRRLTNVTQGSEQAINSMRSQLLISLDQFSGIVIFATNLVENYDKAFETRIRHIQFTLPDAQGRAAVWRRHLVPQLPVGDDVDALALAREVDDVCGRDIKNAVIDAAIRVAQGGGQSVRQADLLAAIKRTKGARIKVPESGIEATADIKEKIKAHLDKRRSAAGALCEDEATMPSQGILS